MSNILDEIFENKRKEVEALKKERPIEELKKAAESAGPTRDFKAAFQRNRTNIIAEIKFKSPSEGIIKEVHNVEEIAQCYERACASAISVLTNKKYFNGDINYLKRVRDAVDLPILRKDFILDKYQIYEARAYGADAYLLIADYLGKIPVERLIRTGNELGLEVLVEVHSTETLKRVIDLPFNLLGINNRNLETMTMEMDTTTTILEKYRDKLNNKTIITESGFNSRDEIVELENKGIRGFLIGTTLMQSEDPEQKLKELRGMSCDQ